MTLQKSTIVIIVLATFSISYSLRIALKRQPIAAQDRTLQHTVAADELYRLSGHCPDVKSAYTRNLVMMATCEREYQEDTVKINKLAAALGLQLVTTPDELGRRRQLFQEYLNGCSERSCEEMEAAKVPQDKMIGQYGKVKYSNLAMIEHLNAQSIAHLHAQGERQALVRSKFTRRNDMIDACEKGYQQDIGKIDELQASLLFIQQLAVGDELYRRLCLKLTGKQGAMKFVEECDEIHDCIEELKRELNGRSERNCEEMEAVKDIQGKLIGKYKELKYLNLATIKGLNAQISAHLTAQIEMQALMRLELARRNLIIEDYENERAQDTTKINDLQAALGIPELTAADELHRRICIEELKKEFNCRSKRSYKEMDAAKDLQDELIGMYGELKYVCLATIKALEEKAVGEGRAKKLRGEGKGKATMQNQGVL